MAYTMLRGGLVLDIRAGTADPTDILIEDDTIRELGPPGCPAPVRRARDLRRAPAHPSRPRQRPHPQPWQPRQGAGRPLDLGTPADRGAVGRRQPRRRGHPGVGPARRRRDAAEGLHRLLRSVLRMAGAEQGRDGAGRLGLCRSGHPRGDRADGRRPHLLRGDPGPRRGAAGGLARAGRGVAAGPGRGDAGGDPHAVARLVVRPRPGPARRGADDPAPLLGCVHPGLRRPRPRIRHRAAQPCRRIESPGGDRHPGLRPHPDRASRSARRPGAAFHRRARGLARQ